MDLPKVSVFVAGQAFSLIQHRVALDFAIQRMRSEWPTAELVQLPALARLEITVALRHIFARTPTMTAPATWRDSAAIRGPLHVPMVFGN
jgi:cytochrome P450